MKDYFVSAALLAVMFLLGVSVNRLLRQRSTPTWALVTGFMALHASFFLFTYIFRAAGLGFTALFRTYSVFIVSALLASVFVFLYKGLYKEYIRSATAFFSKKAGFKIGLLLLILMLFVLSFCISLRENPDSDDSFYLAKAMEIIKTDRLSFREFEIWLGWDDPVMHDSTDASTLETLYAYLSVLFGLPVAVLCRKAVIISFTAVVCCTVFNLGISLFRDYDSRLKALAMTAVYLLLCVQYNAIFDSVPYRQIFTMWHGKALVCSVIFPCIMTVCMDIYCHGEKIVFSEWLLLALIITASVSVSIIGVNFTAIFCVVMAAPFLIYRLIKRQSIVPFLLPAVTAMLPIIIFSGISLLTVIKSNPFYFADFTPPDLYNSFSKQFITESNGVILLLFIAANLYFLFRGTLNQKLLLVGTSAFLVLTFLNPLFANAVAKYLTTSSVYWRLYWIFPIWTIIPAALVGALAGIERKNRRIYAAGFASLLAALCLVLYSYSGTAVFSDPVTAVRCWYPKRNNPYGLSSSCVAAADAILADSDSGLPLLLDLSNGRGLMDIRQYTADIGLCFGIRDDQVEEHTELIPGSDVPISDLILDLRSDVPCEDAELLHAALRQVKADYIYVWSELLPENDFLSPVLSAGKMVLYRVEQA